MRNMADIQEQIAEVQSRIGSMEAELREHYQDLRDLQEELKEGCSHPIEFQKRHFIPRDEPLASDTEYYTCNICGLELERNGKTSSPGPR